MKLEEIKECVDYNPITGIFYFKKRMGCKKIGSIAGSRRKRTGYISININNKAYYAHRLAIWISTGVYPDNYIIDHINHDASDNRLSNLRMTTHQVNCQNRKHSTRGDSIIPGVYYVKETDKYRIVLCVNNKRKSFGYFKDRNEAEEKCIQLRRALYVGNTL